MADTLHRYAQDLDRVLAVSRAMTGERDLERLLDIILAAAKDLLVADRCSLFLVDQASGELWTRIAQGSGTIRLPKGKGIAGSVATAGQLVNIPDAYADERFDRSNDTVSGYKTHSILAMPLISHEDKVVGVLQVLNKDGDGAFDAYDEQLATALCSQAAVAVDTAQLIERDLERRRLEQEMALAHTIQQSLLPQQQPEIGGWRFAHYQVPCDATGGDYHDYLHGDALDLVVGDVSGHGIGAALLMSTARASLRALAAGGGEPSQLLERLNGLLAVDMADDKFMTMLLCRLGADGSCRYASAGHEPPLVYRTGSGAFDDELDSTGLMLGVLDDADYGQVEIPALAPGDVLVGFTDGIFEAVNEAEEQWGMERLRAAIAANAGRGAKAVLGALTAGVRSHIGTLPMEDDLTVVVAERVG